jgi:hypothetical protein
VICRAASRHGQNASLADVEDRCGNSGPVMPASWLPGWCTSFWRVCQAEGRLKYRDRFRETAVVLTRVPTNAFVSRVFLPYRDAARPRRMRRRIASGRVTPSRSPFWLRLVEIAGDAELSQRRRRVILAPGSRSVAGAPACSRAKRRCGAIPYHGNKPQHLNPCSWSKPARTEQQRVACTPDVLRLLIMGPDWDRAAAKE